MMRVLAIASAMFTIAEAFQLSPSKHFGLPASMEHNDIGHYAVRCGGLPRVGSERRFPLYQKYLKESSRNLAMTAGAGFGSKKRRLKLEYGGSSSDPQEQTNRWERAYKSYISRMGKYLTAMSWEGHQRYGRGAIYANNQTRRSAEPGNSPKRWDRFGGLPTLYVPKQKYEEREPQTQQERANLQEIISRIASYDAMREFVVVFEAAGLMGVDVVRPSTPPPETHKILGAQDYDMSDKEDQAALAQYWLNPGEANAEDNIDMTSLIMDAMEKEGSVLDISQKLEELAGDDHDSSSRPM